jgi:CRP-like cAMP-binding protein
MNINELRESFRGTDFFEDISQEHLEKIASIAHAVHYPPGKVVFREGELATEMYLILSGQVSLELCAPGIGCRRVVTLGSGEILGWSPVLQQDYFRATARTMTRVDAIALPGPQIVALCEHDLRFGYEFMRRTALALAKRLTAAQMQLLNVFGADHHHSGKT